LGSTLRFLCALVLLNPCFFFGGIEKMTKNQRDEWSCLKVCVQSNDRLTCKAYCKGANTKTHLFRVIKGDIKELNNKLARHENDYTIVTPDTYDKEIVTKLTDVAYDVSQPHQWVLVWMHGMYGQGKRVLDPVRRTTQRYIASWQNQTQQRFLIQFKERMLDGSAFRVAAVGASKMHTWFMAWKDKD
jgi:hypothetical protein